LPPALLADALAGGAALGASVSTLYLKEPTALPGDLQARLHDLLTSAEDTPDRPRILAGSCTDLTAAVRAGRFLEELYCALAPLVLHLPPLRQRKHDLPWLVERLLERARDLGRPEGRPAVTGLTPDAWEVVLGYHWPGNLRELYRVLTDACGRARGDRIDAADLPVYLRPDATATTKPDRPLALDEVLKQAERRLIELALRRAGGKKGRAAELLSIWRQRLVRRMEALGIADREGPVIEIEEAE
jgi:DNA-binding NtrC family response regulator